MDQAVYSHAVKASHTDHKKDPLNPIKYLA